MFGRSVHLLFVFYDDPIPSFFVWPVGKSLIYTDNINPTGYEVWVETGGGIDHRILRSSIRERRRSRRRRDFRSDVELGRRL